MRRGGEIPLDTNANTELLNELASKTFLRRFTRIDFAAGKFPFERHASRSAPLGGKNESITFDDGAGNMDMLQMNSPDEKRTFIEILFGRFKSDIVYGMHAYVVFTRYPC